MSESKHTPGPWEFLASTEAGCAALWNPETRQEILVPDGINAGDRPITWMGEEMSDEDRILIQAAPDLLEALSQILDDMGEDGLSVCQAAKEQARAALAKATGGSDG